MPLPTINDVQAVEPILQNLLVGYQQSDERFVASRVFPGVAVDKDSGTYYIFTKKYWFRTEMEQRAPGQQYPRADFGTETSTYATLQWALSVPLADEVKANSQIPMSLEEAATRWLAQQSLLRKEISFGADFMVTGVWGTDDNNSATDWDDFSSGDPVNDLFTAKRTVSNGTGVDPNTMVLGYIVHQALMNHPDIIDRIKYTQAATQASIEQALGAVLGFERYLVGKAVYSNTNESAAFSSTSIIDDDCLVAYVTPNP